MKPLWYVTAGRRNLKARDFLDDGYVAIGFAEVGDLTRATSKNEVLRKFEQAYPDQTAKQISVRASQFWRYLHNFAVGDGVLTYDSDARLYCLGEIIGPSVYLADDTEQLRTRRSVRWYGSVIRDALSQATRNSLGAIMTLFLVPERAAAEIRETARNAAPASATSALNAQDQGSILNDSSVVEDAFSDIESLALERVKDRIQALDWEEMQQLVAALLRAIGYRTTVSPRGADRGRDIIASRDGFGFEPPRILIEVKHRAGTSGAPVVRQLKGAIGDQYERGMLVSTGGFSRDAQYAADKEPITLMGIDELASALIDNYERLDEPGRKLLPLTRIYWPI